MTYYYEPGLGSWLSKGIKKAAGWVAGKGNTPGTPEIRKYGYDRAEVAAAVARNLQNPAAITPDNKQAQMLLLGGAAAVALIALMGKKRGR